MCWLSAKSAPSAARRRSAEVLIQELDAVLKREIAKLSSAYRANEMHFLHHLVTWELSPHFRPQRLAFGLG